MPPANELISNVLRWRIDSMLLGCGVLAAWYGCSRYVRRRGAGRDFSPANGIAVVVLALAGALLAESLGIGLGYSGSVPLVPLALARAAGLGAVALFAGILLTGATRFALLQTEIRARADAERQLQAAKAAADEASRAKSDFLAVMSHEIRTPLNAVMGFANLLADTRLDDVQRGYLATVTSEGARLGSLINDILDLTKIEEGRLVLERLPFSPAEIAHESLRLLSVRAQERQLDLRFEAQLAGPLLVAGDPLRFRQVLVNLIDNAVKFTPRGSVTLFLHWTPPAGGTPHGLLNVRVCDTGIGIDPAKLRTLFQMFVQADTSTTRRFGGTGLGLAICQRLVCMMGGEIGVTSVHGEGSEFFFTLPLPPVAQPSESAAPVRQPSGLPARSPRVLVVDDMEANRFLLEVFLKRSGFTPTLAAGGEEALRLTASNHYDAILMDLHMPDMDGYAVTKCIRARETDGRHTPIIALTATITKGTRERCLAAGMDEYLTKPLDLKKFKALLERFVAAEPAMV